MADETETRNAGERLRDSEIALLDALKLVIEVLIATGTVQGELFARLFAQQRDGYLAKEMPDAAVIMEVLRGFAARRPPAPQKPRPELDKPQGSA